MGNFKPRQYVLPEAEAHMIEVDARRSGASPRIRASQAAGTAGWSKREANVRAHGASYVLCHCHWQANPSQCLTVLLVHGLEGSAHSQYMLGNSARAWAAGCNVIRMNMRNCGGTEDLSPTLYHSGLSADVAAVMRTLAAEKGLNAFALVGYSMGGNLVLKLAGEMGAECAGLSESGGWRFAGDGSGRFGGCAAQHIEPGLRVEVSARLAAALSAQGGVVSRNLFHSWSGEDRDACASLTIRITARYSGFTGADDYYDRASSSRVAAQIAVPALILHALDDPFVSMLPATRAALLAQSPGAAGRDRAWRPLRIPGAGCGLRRLLGGEDAAGLSALGYQTLMEADWSVALAADDPVITVPWAASGRRPASVSSSICAWAGN